MFKNNYQKGQVGIIVILVGIVIFTLGISTAARVTRDVRISDRSEEGARAAAAADAAVEIALSVDPDTIDTETLSTTNGPFYWSDAAGPNSTVFADLGVTPIPLPTDISYDAGSLEQGEVRTIWLLNDPDNINGTSYDLPFQISWTGIDTEVEIIILYNSNSSTEPVSSTRRFIKSPNYFSVDTNDDTTPTSLFPKPDPLSPLEHKHTYMARIKPVKGSIDNLTISWVTGPFPIQEYQIEAVGWTANSQVFRRINTTRLVGNLPSFFDYVLANTGGPIVKN